MTALWIILGIIAALIVYTLIKAAFWKSKPAENAEKQEPERVDFDRYCKNLSDAIKIKTISNYDSHSHNRLHFKNIYSITIVFTYA